MIKRRADFGQFCNDEGFTRAVEVGTHQGYFANEFLEQFHGHLTCIDSWEGSEREFFPAFLGGRTYGELDYEIAKLILTKKFLDRVKIIRKRWEDAAASIKDESVHFGYIDGLHTTPFVKRDMELMWPKIVPGGVMAGHDYEPNDPTLIGVVIAVNGFAYQHEVSVDMTREVDQPRSWFIRKV